jgi:hypothetical protein
VTDAADGEGAEPQEDGERAALERRLVLWAADSVQGLYLRDWVARRDRAEHRLRAAAEPTRMAGDGRWMRVTGDALTLHARLPPRDAPDMEPAVLAVPLDRVAAVVAAGLEGRTAQVYDEAMTRTLELSTRRERPEALRVAVRQQLRSASVAVVENGLRLLRGGAEGPGGQAEGATEPERVLLLEVVKIVGLQHLFPEADALPRAIVRARRYGRQRLPDGSAVVIDRAEATLTDPDGRVVAHLRWTDLPRWIARTTTREERAEHQRLLAEHDETSAEVWARTERVVDGVLRLDDVRAEMGGGA